MSSSSSSPFHTQSQLTSFCIKLLHRINGKFDNKINQMEQTLISEYEQKIAELQVIKEQIDKYHKIKSCIAELNAFYNFTHKGTKLITTVLPPAQPAPYITTKHNICQQVLLQQDNLSVSVSVQNGDCVQNEPNQPPKLVQPACLINGSTDALFGPSAPKNARVCIRKQHSVSKAAAAAAATAATADMMVIETQATDIIIDFKNHEVRPEQINLRYACFSHENKGTFSYIDTVLGSHDGTTWVVLEQADMLAMRNFAKSNVFKFPIVLSSSASTTPTFYKYICLRSSATKDLTHKNNLHKMFNKTHIPISSIEMYGHYSAPSNTNILTRHDMELHNFVKSFLQFKHTDQTRNVELDYILNMFLESYKELNSLITSTKINQALADNRPTAPAEEAAPAEETAPAEAAEGDTEEAAAEEEEEDEVAVPATAASLPAIQEEQEQEQVQVEKPIKVLDLFDMTTKIVATPSKRKNKKSAAAAF